ncbi:MAG: hypothetical protein ABH869_05910 [Candidatus Omnitrophota bacterium]
MIGIGFFLIRITVFVIALYLIYFVHKSWRKPAEKKVAKVITTCPSPKVFIDYTEGRIKGKLKKNIDDHIACCENCQDALKEVFDLPRKKS